MQSMLSLGELWISTIKWSVFKPYSEISAINANAGVGFVSLSSDTMLLLKRSLYFSRITEGVFDITAAPLIALWGIGKKHNFIPSKKEISHVKRLCNYHGLILDETNSRAMLAHRGQSINLGAIAKGYAADEVKRILGESGIQNAMINLGGNIWAVGEGPSAQSWMIGIQNPMEPTGEAMGHLLVRDQTIVTSGSYEHFFIKNGMRYHHILDPRTGQPAKTNLLGITVIGNCSMDMDALATSVFIMGYEKGTQLIERMGAQAIFIDTSQNVFITKELRDKFHLCPKGILQKQRGVI